jgi:hypothetical protein
VSTTITVDRSVSVTNMEGKHRAEYLLAELEETGQGSGKQGSSMIPVA